MRDERTSEQTTEDRATQPMEALEAESRKKPD